MNGLYGIRIQIDRYEYWTIHFGLVFVCMYVLGGCGQFFLLSFHLPSKLWFGIVQVCCKTMRKKKKKKGQRQQNKITHFAFIE